MKRYHLAVLLALAAPAAPLFAQTTPQAAEEAPVSPLDAAAQGVVAVLKGQRAPADVFARSFLDAVPEAQLKALTAQLERSLVR